MNICTHAASSMEDEAKRKKVRIKMQKQIEKILTKKKLFYVQSYICFVTKILPEPVTGKKPLILADCLADRKEIAV